MKRGNSIRYIILFNLKFQVEMLYQRYFLKMNQSNMTTLITLLLVLCISLLFLAGADVITRHSIEAKYEEDNSIQFQDRLDKLVVLMCTSGCCIAIYGGNN